MLRRVITSFTNSPTPPLASHPPSPIPALCSPRQVEEILSLTPYLLLSLSSVSPKQDEENDELAQLQARAPSTVRQMVCYACCRTQQYRKHNRSFACAYSNRMALVMGLDLYDMRVARAVAEGIPHVIGHFLGILVPPLPCSAGLRPPLHTGTAGPSPPPNPPTPQPPNPPSLVRKEARGAAEAASLHVAQSLHVYPPP